ncbi:MAG TPA: hypothetical protein VG410_11865 [Solirubrobacteraceae bacterium]|nr:hypothetical protein [Solirubrobacteraceae bacterium]
MRFPPSTALVWFGVLGGAGAWATQFVANLFLTFAQCNAPPGRSRLPVHGVEIGLSAAAVTIGLASAGVSLWLYRRTSSLDHVAQDERHGEGSAPPTGRINFLATVGLCVNFLAIAIVVMTGIGAPLLPVCMQS